MQKVPSSSWVDPIGVLPERAEWPVVFYCTLTTTCTLLFD